MLFLNYQTVCWRKDLAEVSSLVAKGLLLAVPDTSSVGGKPFTIPRFVWEHLQKTRSQFIENTKKLLPKRVQELTAADQ